MRLISFTTVSLALGTAVFLSGCAGTIDPTRGVPVGYYTTGAQALDKATIDHVDHDVLPRCTTFAKETNPKPAVIGLAYGVNHAKAGLVGGTLGAAAEYGVFGAALGWTRAGGIGVGTAISAGFQARESGEEQGNMMIFGAKKNCVKDDALGVHDIAPSEAKKIRTGQQGPTVYGPPTRSQLRDAASNPQ